MNTQSLFQNLAYGILANLADSYVDETTGNIIEEKKPQIIHFADEGLLRIYSRFQLKENSIIIEPIEHITNYHLLPRFAENHEPREETFTYIKDLPYEKFEGDVIKILAVYSVDGRKLPLNDVGRPDSVFTPEPLVLQLGYRDVLKPISVLYQAKHLPLDLSKPDQNIYLPDVLQPALFSYIGYKVYSSINTPESASIGVNHLSMFEATCSEVENRDLINSSVVPSISQFDKKGWV